MLSNRIRTTGAMIALVAGLACAPTAIGQTAPIASHDVAFHVNSGPIFLPGNITDGDTAQLAWTQEISVPTASWLRLKFDEAVFGDGAYMIITSMKDGYRHILNANTIRDWENTSAYMNGDTVIVEVFVVPGTAASSIRMSEVTAGDFVDPTVETICGTTDDRTPLNDGRCARLMPIGCTAWLISANGNANEFLTAGHCFPPTSGAVVQFNVPLSTSGGSTVSPPPEFQFPVQSTSVQFTQTGDDAARFFTSANSNTGLAPRIAMNGRSYLIANAPAASNQTMRVTGYGTGGSAGNTWSQFGKTHTGPYTAKSGTQLRYRVDTTGGNSGSPVTMFLGSPLSLEYGVGIHTNAGCDTSSSSYNNGTDIAFSTLQGWLSSPAGTPIAYQSQSCRATLYNSNNGGAQNGAVYFDAVVGDEDIRVNSMMMNLSTTTSQYTFNVFITPGGFAGKESNAAAWTQIASGGGVVNDENTATPATLFDTFVLHANTTYGMAIVLNGAEHEYTDGNGTNQSYSSTGLTLNLGSASNTPFGTTIQDRVWNGTICFQQTGTATCAEVVNSTTTGMTLIDMDNIGLGSTNAAELNGAGTPFNGRISSVSAPDKPGVAAGIYDTNISFGRGLARVNGTMNIISNNGTAAFDATTFDIRLNGQATEFGVRIGDFTGSVRVIFVDGNTPVATIEGPGAGSSPTLFRTTCPFNRILVDTTLAGGNFVITELVVPNNCTVSEIGSMTVAASEIDMDSLPLGSVTIAALNNAGAPNDAIISSISMPTKSTAAAGVYDTNTSFGRALARVSGVRNIISNNGTAAFDAVTYDITFNRNVTQFGAEIGDFNGNLRVTLRDAADNVVGIADSTSNTNSGAIFFRSSCPFRSAEVDVASAAGNFVMTEIWTEAAPANCYADCDQNGTLNIFDYICFGNAYAAGQAYADCDGSGSLNIFDYICFGNKYAAGCP
ncbi:MAG: hypothetical protein H6815_04455 [Phycisphaeraceae bacterium]|nr:hypothetical protein [Phycisphaerales bacterium]MCB9859684.1 hypothetical protein [Phycisphaeraceae bacterium]